MIYLASRSPRRHELLKKLNIEFSTVDVAIDETWNGSEPASAFVMRLAKEKARSARKLFGENAVVLAADTIVVIDDEILGKPNDPEHARAMLHKLSGKTHHVLTAVTLYSDDARTVLNENRISFKTLSDEEIARYIDTGEPLDKAGSYAIQGRAASFITEVTGSYSGVMGLPLATTRQLLLRPWHKTP